MRCRAMQVSSLRQRVLSKISSQVILTGRTKSQHRIAPGLPRDCPRGQTMPRSSSLVLATEREIRNAKPTGERSEFRVKSAKNLVLRITPSGRKTWAFLYASPSSGHRRKLSLGTYPATGLSEARSKALALTLEVQGGGDPLTQRHIEQAGETFAKLAQRYLAEHERRNARAGRRSQSTDQAERLLRADILPVLCHHRAEAVTKQQVREAIEAAADLAPSLWPIGSSG
jgi:Arm domain-containing DNA-binding protein